MKWSWRIGRIFGIDLKIHLTFFFLLAYVGFIAFSNGGTAASAAMDILFIIVLFLFVVMHEFGHALMAKRFRIPTKDITLLPIGGVARLESMPEDPKEELLVAIAGPLVNVVIAGVLFAGLLISGFFFQPLSIELLLGNFWVRLLSVNLTLVAFNLIPAFPMDGGRVLRSLLATRIPHVKATRIAANIGKGFALLLGITGFFVNPWLVLTAIFIWSGAGAEAQSVEIKAGLKGLSVRDALVTQYTQVDANQPLGSVFQLAMQSGQRYIPVVSNGNFLGFIQSSSLLRTIERYGDRAPAYSGITLEPEKISPDLPLQDAFVKFSTVRVLPVTVDRELIGFITPESVQQRMWLNQRIKKSSQQPPEETVKPI